MDIIRLRNLLDSITAGEEKILKYLPKDDVDPLFYMFLMRAMAANIDAYYVKNNQEAYYELELYVPLLIGYIQAKRKNKVWLNVYKKHQFFGGQEEGGWWYWYFEPIISKLIEDPYVLHLNPDPGCIREISKFPARHCYSHFSNSPGFKFTPPHYE